MLCNLWKDGGAHEVVIGFGFKADRSAKIIMLDFHDRYECVPKISGRNCFHRCIPDTPCSVADVITCMPATYERAALRRGASGDLKKCRFYPLGAERCLAQADTRGIEYGVGDGGGDRTRCRLTRTQQQIIRMV